MTKFKFKCGTGRYRYFFFSYLYFSKPLVLVTVLMRIRVRNTGWKTFKCLFEDHKNVLRIGSGSCFFLRGYPVWSGSGQKWTDSAKLHFSYLCNTTSIVGSAGIVLQKKINARVRFQVLRSCCEIKLFTFTRIHILLFRGTVQRNFDFPFFSEIEPTLAPDQRV